MMNIPIRICGATTSVGTPCKRAVAPGLTRCKLHGGASPQALATAERYLAIARVPAAEVLLEIIETWNRTKCDACGQPKGDPMPIIRAATVVLDRAGLHPTVQVQHTVGGGDDIPALLSFLPQDRLDLMVEWLNEAQLAMKAAEHRLALPPAHVIDAEVVPTDEPGTEV